MAAHRNLLRPVIWSNHISDNHINLGKHEAWHQLIQPLLHDVHSNCHRRTSLPTRITVYNGVRLVHYISSYSEFRNHIIDGLYSVDNRQDLQGFHHADQLIDATSNCPASPSGSLLTWVTPGVKQYWQLWCTVCSDIRRTKMFLLHFTLIRSSF